MQIRASTLADAPAIARVHVDSWRTTYVGILPDEVLANLSYERGEQRFTKILGELPPTACHFVAEDAGRIVGFATGGPFRGDLPGYTGELYAIYLLKAAQGAGTGRALFDAVTGFLKQQGHTSMLIWVAEANHPARRFYERMGGQVGARKGEPVAGVPLVEIGYGFTL